MTRKGNDDVDKSLENFVKPMQVNLFLASFSLMELLCAITAADFLPFGFRQSRRGDVAVQAKIT